MTCFGIRSLQRWKKQEPQLREMPKYKLRGRMRIRQKGVGKFPRVELSLLEEIKRRFKADPCSQNWIKSRMKQLCNEMKPKNYDPEKDKLRDTWVQGFFERKGLSMRVRTNQKKETVWQRWHKLQNYQHFIIYRMRNKPISDIESDTSSEECETSSEESETSSDASETNSDESET